MEVYRGQFEKWDPINQSLFNVNELSISSGQYLTYECNIEELSGREFEINKMAFLFSSLFIARTLKNAR